MQRQMQRRRVPPHATPMHGHVVWRDDWCEGRGCVLGSGFCGVAVARAGHRACLDTILAVSRLLGLLLHPRVLGHLHRQTFDLKFICIVLIILQLAAAREFVRIFSFETKQTAYVLRFNLSP